MPRKKKINTSLDNIDVDDIVVDGKFYQGNENILRKDALFKWTDDMREELKLCAKSVLHFAENHFYIITEDGKRKIELYKYQKSLLKAFKNNRFNVILSSRQSGKTTTITIYALWLVCFQSDKRITIVANKESTAKEIFSRIKMAYEQLPIYLKPNIKSWRKDGFNLGNDSAITVSTTSSSGPRGSTSNLLIIDEMAHCPNELMKELWRSAIPIISSMKKSQIVVISTPNGTDNIFFLLVMVLNHTSFSEFLSINSLFSKNKRTFAWNFNSGSFNTFKNSLGFVFAYTKMSLFNSAVDTVEGSFPNKTLVKVSISFSF
jgi:hypothetical protein